MTDRQAPQQTREMTKAAPPAGDEVTGVSTGYDLVREIFRVAASSRPRTVGVPRRQLGLAVGVSPH
jgi:hypothetical protein